MSEPDTDEFVRRAEAIYDRQLRQELEVNHKDDFVAIEPESGDYFLGKSLSEAMVAARRSHPDKLAHAMRVGHKAALHFGMKAGCRAASIAVDVLLSRLCCLLESCGAFR
jgi:hypothetical protein